MRCVCECVAHVKQSPKRIYSSCLYNSFCCVLFFVCYGNAKFSHLPFSIFSSIAFPKSGTEYLYCLVPPRELEICFLCMNERGLYTTHQARQKKTYQQKRGNSESKKRQKFPCRFNKCEQFFPSPHLLFAHQIVQSYVPSF